MDRKQPSPAGKRRLWHPGTWSGMGAADVYARNTGQSQSASSQPPGTGSMTTARPMDRTDGYSRLSIFVHWVAALLIVLLFLTHEAERGTVAHTVHVSGGAVVGLFLLWRVWHRTRRGTASAPEQWALFNFAARFVHWALLVAIVVVVISGYLLPWTLGRELDVFGFAIPSPLAASRGLHEFMEGVHDVAGHAFVPLLAVHVLGGFKHIVFDRRGAGLRMFKPTIGGR